MKIWDRIDPVAGDRIKLFPSWFLGNRKIIQVATKQVAEKLGLNPSLGWVGFTPVIVMIMPTQKLAKELREKTASRMEDAMSHFLKTKSILEENVEI